MFSEPKIQEMINLYEVGKSQKEIANIFACSQTNVSSILRRKGVKCRDRKDVFKNQKYTDVNTSFFKEINNEGNAYFLGFLYADGGVQTKNSAYCVTLKLKSNDQIIIQKLRDIMSPSSPVKITGGKYSYFRINQKEVCEQLIALGCVPNKSLILEFPTKVPANLIRHFLRGYSDGDGCIYKNRFKKKKTINTIWKIISTKQFCEQTAKILKKELGINCSQSLSKPKKNQITTVLSVGGNLQVKKVLDWLYQDATIYLPRKYDKYQEFLNGENSSAVSSNLCK
jgi:intein-encoded DNA endonuclease-like protein